MGSENPSDVQLPHKELTINTDLIPQDTLTQKMLSEILAQMYRYAQAKAASDEDLSIKNGDQMPNAKLEPQKGDVEQLGLLPT